MKTMDYEKYEHFFSTIHFIFQFNFYYFFLYVNFHSIVFRSIMIMRFVCRNKCEKVLTVIMIFVFP